MGMLLSGADIAALRKKLGLNLKEFGERMGVTEATACRWENETRRPDYEKLVELSNLAERYSNNGHARRQAVGAK